jgi:hypothetical protein
LKDYGSEKKMLHTKVGPTGKKNHAKNWGVMAILLITLAALGLMGYTAIRTKQAAALLQNKNISISQSVLEEQYGLKVQLVATTASGGLVDVRIRITDGKKAQALLGDQANFPSLRAGNGVTLRASEDVVKQEIKFEDNSSLFVLYPNTRNSVKPGDRVGLDFGNLRLEAVSVQ